MSCSAYSQINYNLPSEETLSVAIYGDRGATAQRDYTHYTKRFEEQVSVEGMFSTQGLVSVE